MGRSTAMLTGGNAPLLQRVYNDYSTDMFTWFDDIIAPDMINNGSLSGQLTVEDMEAYRADGVQHVDGQKPKVIGQGALSFVSYALDGHSQAFEQSSVQDAKYLAGGQDPDAMYMQQVQSIKLKFRIARAKEVYAIASASANFNSNCVTAAGDALTSDAANPISYFDTNRAAQLANGNPWPNLAVFNDISYNYLTSHPAVLSRLSLSNQEVASIEQLAKLLKVKEIIVTDAQENTANTGATASMSRIWADVALLMFKNPVVNPNAVSQWDFMRTVRNTPSGVGTVELDEQSSAKSPVVGGYYNVYDIKDGMYQPLLISRDDSSDTKVGGLITGLY